MPKYQMMCSCGHAMDVDAESREEGVAKMKGMMTEEAIAAHMKEFHKPEEPMMSVADVHAGIEQGLQEVTA